MGLNSQSLVHVLLTVGVIVTSYQTLIGTKCIIIIEFEQMCTTVKFQYLDRFTR